jgi:PAS domain S-box-containing protein
MSNAGATGLSSLGSELRDRNCEEQFHRWAGLIPNLFYRLDQNGVIVWASPSMVVALERSLDELVGKRFEDIFLPEKTVRPWAAIISHLDHHTPIAFPHALRLPSGEKWVETRLAARPDPITGIREIIGLTREVGRPLPADATGSATADPLQIGLPQKENVRPRLPAAPGAAVSLDSEITKRQRAEAALRRNESVLHATIESISDGLLVATQSGRISHYNRRFLDLWSIPRALAEERQDKILVEHVAPQISNPTEFQDEVVRIYQFEAATEDLLQLKDGRVFERRSYPVITPGEEPSRVWLFRDVTAERQAAAAWVNKTEELDRFFTLALDLLCIADTAGKFLRLNPQWESILGYPLHELEGLSFLDLVHPEDLPATMAALSQLGNQERVVNFVNRYRCQDGSYRWIEWRSQPAGDRIYAAARDITDRKRAEDELRLSEERIGQLASVQRTILNTINIGISFLKHRKHQWVNSAFADIFGYQEHELEGLDSARFYANEADYDRVGREGYTQLAAAGIYTTEALMQRKDGTQFWCSITGQAVNPRDLAEGTIWALRDVTERRRIAAALERERLFANAVLDSVPGLLYLYDDQGCLVRWNKQHETITGYSVKELGSMRLLDWYRGEPEEAARIMAAVRRIPVEGHAETEAKLVTKDGRRVPFYFTAVGLRIDQRDYFVGVGIDITERRRMEDSLRESEQRFRAVVANAQAVIFLLDSDGVFLISEGQGLAKLGLAPGEVVGRSAFDIYRDVPSVLGGVKLALAGKANRTENVLGNLVFDTVYSPYIAPDGQPAGVVGVAIEITERKRAEAALLASLEEKEALLKEVHHRVKNNLQIVTSLLSLQAGRERQESVKSALGDMQSRVRAMALLHEALYRSASLAQIDFGAYARNLCVQLARSYQQSGQAVRLEVQISDLHLDLERSVPCGLIISELVTNAFKHAFSDGRDAEIRVTSYKPTPAEIEIRIVDNGLGLPVAFDLARAGTLGLQLVSRLTDQLGGVVQVEPGAGADFRIRFPLPLPSAVPSSNENSSAATTPSKL